ncbi:hypothetical protein F66182_2710 [Fusarium sp. NRRL 66182]|nr:hypothetical protein F66182_2710 [Fusarium sp. NRRL 66182]
MLLLQALAFITAALASNLPKPQAKCNGYAELCDRKYSNITFIGTHNSAFEKSSHFVRGNQGITVTQQLNLGVRFLQAPMHFHRGRGRMCHADCFLLDEGPVTDYLQEISDWLARNPAEVVTLLLTNRDRILMEETDAEFEQTGLKKLVYNPPHRLAKDHWPTLQELISKGKRLVVFMDAWTDQRKVPYVLPQWDYFWETHWGELDPEFPRCDVDRPGGGNPDKLMGIMNHMLYYSEWCGAVKGSHPSAASYVNSKQSIMKHVELCKSRQGKVPNVILTLSNMGMPWKFNGS